MKLLLLSSLGQPERNKMVGSNGRFSPQKYILWSVVIPAGLFVLAFVLLPPPYFLVPNILVFCFAAYLGFRSAKRNNKITGRS